MLQNLSEMSLDDVIKLKNWRNGCLQACRTPYLLTDYQQSIFYTEKICNPSSNSTIRYWAYKDESSNEMIGAVGIVDICGPNKSGEIAIVLNPKYRGQGHGKKAVLQCLEMAFNYLNLDVIYVECYQCNPYLNFWLKLAKEMDIQYATLKRRKYWDGEYYDSVFYSITKEIFSAYAK